MAGDDPITLDYGFGSVNPHDIFDRARPWRGRLGAWDCVLENGRLSATAVESFESEPAATASLEPMLRAWEAAAFLRDQHEIFFRPDRPAADSEIAGKSNRDYVFRRVNETYPAPDPTFTRTPLVESLLEVIHSFMAGSIALPVAIGELDAALESAARDAGAGSVADAYNIDREVAETLAELAQRGAAAAAEGQAVYRGPEWQWMQEALRLIALQVGRRTMEPPTGRLQMEDFKTRL